MYALNQQIDPPPDELDPPEDADGEDDTGPENKLGALGKLAIVPTVSFGEESLFASKLTFGPVDCTPKNILYSFILYLCVVYIYMYIKNI